MEGLSTPNVACSGQSHEIMAAAAQLTQMAPSRVEESGNSQFYSVEPCFRP